MQKKEIEKLTKTVEKLSLQLQESQAIVKSKEFQIKQLTRENKSLLEKWERGKKKNAGLQEELKKNAFPYLSFLSKR